MTKEERKILAEHTKTIHAAILGGFKVCDKLELLDGVTSLQTSNAVIKCLNSEIEKLVLENKLLASSWWTFEFNFTESAFLTFNYTLIFDWKDFYKLILDRKVVANSEENIRESVVRATCNLIELVNNKAWYLK